MLDLKYHTEALRRQVAKVDQVAMQDFEGLGAGDAAEMAADLVQAAGEVAALFVQAALAKQAKRPKLVPVGHGGPRGGAK